MLEFLFDLSRHHDNFAARVRSRLVVELDLLITRSLDSDADLEVTSDLRKVFSLRIKQGDPLVLDSMLWFEVD